jgi:hypothetical protein
MIPSRFALLALTIALAPSASVSAAEPDRHFDGTWDTDGVLHGEKGTKGKPGWLQLDGKILTDGSAKIYAEGLVGAADAAVGHRPAGTQYGYHIEAKFSEDSGNGKRVEGRACTVAFEKKR